MHTSNKMAKRTVDFLFGDDLEEIYNIIDSGFLEEQEVDKDVDKLLDVNVESEKKCEGFQCSFCAKICKSKPGLARHVSTKHKEDSVAPTASNTMDKTQDQTDEELMKKFHPFKLRDFVVASAQKLSMDMCFQEDVRSIFAGFTFNGEESLNYGRK